MPEIPKIPDLPEKDELQFKSQELMLSLKEQYQATSKRWFYALLAFLVMSVPIGIGLKVLIQRQLINSYEPPVVNENLYNPEDLQVFGADILPVVNGVYSAYAQVLNPNRELAAWDVEYRFTFSDSSGNVFHSKQGKGYLKAGESKFLLIPRVDLDTQPASVSFQIDSVRFTGRASDLEVEFDILQQNSGVNLENNFFVEAEIRNRQDFRVKKVDVQVLVFDPSNESLRAVNVTSFTDLKSFESRYFRVLWPDPILNIGQIQITASVNPLDPGVLLEAQEGVPDR